MSYALFFCQVKDLMKIHNRGKFHQYSICGCQVKKIQILGSNSASMIWLFEEVFGPLLPQLWSNFAQILTRVNTIGSKNIVWKYFVWIWVFMEKGTDPKFALLVRLWPRMSYWRWPKSKKMYGKTLAIGLSKSRLCQNQGSISSLLSGKIWLLFTLFGLFLVGNRAESQVRGSESKFEMSCFTHTILVNLI